MDQEKKMSPRKRGLVVSIIVLVLIAIIFALYQSENRQTAEEEQPISIDTSSVVLAEARLASAKMP